MSETSNTAPPAPLAQTNGQSAGSHAQKVEPVTASISVQPVPEVLPPPSVVVSETPASPLPKALRDTRVRHYEELDGGQGREVFFRPKRYSAADLAPLAPTVSLVMRGLPRDCSFRNISRSGVAVDVAEDDSVVVGTGARLAIAFDGHEVFWGDGRIERVFPADGKTVIGVSFAESLVDIDDLLRLRDLKTWNQQHGDGHRLSRRLWHTAGQERFKSLVGELRLFFEDASAQLADLEHTLPAQVLHGERDSAARAALIPWLQREFCEPVVNYANEIDAALRTASAAADWHALKEYSLRHVHSFLMQSPAMHRAYMKPCGYPGDFEIMNYVYERNFEGRNLFAKSMNLAFCQTAASQAVRGRKDAVKEKLSALVRGAAGLGRPLRVLSVAAGPAQEVYEWLLGLESSPVPIEIILFDQDHDALTYAFKRLKSITDGPERRHDRIAEVVYLHDSIKRLMTDENIFSAFGRFDAIVCAGFFDYLRGPKATAVAQILYRYLVPGGTAYIGNMTPANQSRWFMEHHLDWYLIYKTHEEMLDFAKKAAPGAEVGILEERSGVNPFVTIKRV